MKRHQHQRPPKPLAATGVTKKGSAYRRIIGKIEDKKREYSLHATKGYRSYRKPAA